MLDEVAQKWLPSHVQVTVLEARDLHPKGKHGTNDTYTIIQLGREKYATSVAEKSLCPVWKEEAAFELPGALDGPDQYQLQLTAMHRSLVGLDKFLGQVSINLNSVFHDRERSRTRWYRLESRPGKRSRERGELRVALLFTRNHMTASMFELSVKEKTRSPFARLRDRMTGRQPGGSDTCSAIVPSSSRLDRDGPDTQLKTQPPKKPPLLGAQRLSSAHSMSELTPPLCVRLGGPGKLDSISSAEEGVCLKSPHRRTLSADTRDPPPAGPALDWTGGPGSGQLLAASFPHKCATLPRQWAPSQDHEGALESGGAGKRDGKKKEKVRLLDRVTGKRRHSQDRQTEGPEWTPETLSNPFRAGSHLPEQRSSIIFSSCDGSVTAQRGLDIYPTLYGPLEMVEGGGAYTHLSRSEVERELDKHKELLKKKDGHIRELEDYIDNLLVRVMEETPSILRVPYVPSRRAGKFSQS